MKDVVDPISDEMLAKFVVDSHFRSKPHGANLDDKSMNTSQDDADPMANQVDPEVFNLDCFLSSRLYQYTPCT